MADGIPTGERYSLLYLKPDEAIADSQRLRTRLAGRFEATVQNEHEGDLGKFLERELGISVLSNSYSTYIIWSEIGKWALRDVLCTITRHWTLRSRSQRESCIGVSSGGGAHFGGRVRRLQVGRTMRSPSRC